MKINRKYINLILIIAVIALFYNLTIRFTAPIALNRVLKMLKTEYDIDISIDSLDLSILFSYALARDIEVRYQDNVILTADLLKVEIEHLIMVLFKEINIKQISAYKLRFSYDESIKELAESFSENGSDREGGFRVSIASVLVKDSDLEYKKDDLSISIEDINLKVFSYLGMFYESNLRCSAVLENSSSALDYMLDLHINMSKNLDHFEIFKPKDNNILLNDSIKGMISGEFDVSQDLCNADILLPIPADIFEGLEGTVFLEGGLSDRLSNPSFSGILFTESFSHNQIPYNIEANVQKKRDILSLNELKVSSDIISGQLSCKLNIDSLIDKTGHLADADFYIGHIDTNRFLSSFAGHESTFYQDISLKGILSLDINKDVLLPGINADMKVLKNDRGYSPISADIIIDYTGSIIRASAENISIDSSTISCTGEYNTDSGNIDGYFTYQINDPADQHRFIRQLVAAEILSGDKESAGSFLEFWDSNIVGSGTGVITGTIKGEAENPLIESELKAQNVVFSGTFLGDISGKVNYFDQKIELLQTVILKGGNRVSADGYIDLMENADKLLELAINSDGYNASDVLGIYGLDVPAESEVTGSIMIGSKGDDVFIDFENIMAEGIRYEDLYLGSGNISGSYRDDILSLDNAEFSLPQGTADASGRYDFKKNEYWLDFESRGSSIFDRKQIKAITGFDNMLADIKLSSGGTLDLINAELSGSFKSIYKEGSSLPDIPFIMNLSENNGTFSIRMEDSVNINGRINDIYNIEADGDINSPDIIRYLSMMSENEIKDIAMPLKGNIAGSINLENIDSLFVQFHIENMNLNFMKKEYINPETIKIVYTSRQLIIKDFLLENSKNIFRISGIIDPVSGYDLNLQSNIDISLFSQFLPSELIYTLRGDSEIYLDLFGKISEPVFQGNTKLANGFIRIRDLSYPITNINGDFYISGTNISVKELNARLNKGELLIGGNILFSTEGIDNVLLNIMAKDISYTWPKTFDSRFNADLRFNGDSRSGFILSGDVNLNYFRYVEKIELASKLSNMIRGVITGRSTYDASASRSEDIVRMDIKVTGERNLSMDNDLGKLSFKADLEVKGGLLNPILLGRAEVISGEIYLLNNTFKELKGNAEFVNPFRLDPNVNFSGKTFINGYNISVAVSGSLDNPVLDLTSSPSLPEIDILSLLGSGRTTQDHMAGGSQTRFGEYGISTILTSNLTSYLEKTAEDLFKFDKITITPILSGSQSDLSAKITIEKRLTNRLFLLYSFSTSYGEEQIAILKYQITSNLNAILQRSEFGSIGADIQLGASFE